MARHRGEAMMNRRGFLTGLGGILAVAAAPAIVRADSLMRVVPVDTSICDLRAAFAAGFSERIAEREALLREMIRVGAWRVHYARREMERQYAEDVKFYEGLRHGI